MFPLWNHLWGHFWPQIPFIQSYLYAHFTSIWNLRSYLIFDLSFPHYHYPGTSDFYVGRGMGMPRCSYATAHPPSLPHQVWDIQSITHKEGRELNKFMPIVTLSFLCVRILTLCTVFFYVTVGGRGFSTVWLAEIQLHYWVCQKIFWKLVQI